MYNTSTFRSMAWRAGGLAGLLLLGLCAGCATAPSAAIPPSGRLALRHAPAIPDLDGLRPDQALLAAFCSANGLHVSPAQLTRIIPHSEVQGRMDCSALRDLAGRHGRKLMVISADERFLDEELQHDRTLLVLLPAGRTYRAATTPGIPVAWDRNARTLELLTGTGRIQTVPEDEFFARREPLKQAALCLVKTGPAGGTEPPREARLVLADFSFDRSSYRNVPVDYSAVQEKSPVADSAQSQVDRGIRLVRKGRFDQAIPVFQAALEKDPDNATILNNLAFCMLHGGGELMTALRHAGRAAELDPGNPLVLETLGSLNLRIGDAASAARYLEQAWGRALRASPEVQIAIMDQLVRAWLAADRRDLAWQVAEYRHQAFPQYRFPGDILNLFPALRRARLVSGQKIVPEGG